MTTLEGIRVTKRKIERLESELKQPPRRERIRGIWVEVGPNVQKLTTELSDTKLLLAQYQDQKDGDGTKIKHYIDTNGLTQEWLAEQLPMDVKTLRKHMNGGKIRQTNRQKYERLGIL